MEGAGPAGLGGGLTSTRAAHSKAKATASHMPGGSGARGPAGRRGPLHGSLGEVGGGWSGVWRTCPGTPNPPWARGRLYLLRDAALGPGPALGQEMKRPYPPIAAEDGDSPPTRVVPPPPRPALQGARSEAWPGSDVTRCHSARAGCGGAPGARQVSAPRRPPPGQTLPPPWSGVQPRAPHSSSGQGVRGQGARTPGSHASFPLSSVTLHPLPPRCPPSPGSSCGGAPPFRSPQTGPGTGKPRPPPGGQPGPGKVTEPPPPCLSLPVTTGSS